MLESDGEDDENIMSLLKRRRQKRTHSQMYEVETSEEEDDTMVTHMSKLQIEVEEARRSFSRASRETSILPNSLVCSWVGACGQLADRLESEEEERRKRLKVVSRVDYVTDPLFGTDQCSGDRRLADFNTTLDSFRWQRTAAQIMFHDLFTNAVLKQIYGVEWEANAVRVMKEQGMRKLHTEVMVMTPRRYGKTVSVAMWVVAALLHIPGVEIGIFSTGQRASTSLMAMAYGFLQEIPGAERRVVKSTDKDLFVCQDPLPDGMSMKSALAQQRARLPTTAKLHSFPSNVEGE